MWPKPAIVEQRDEPGSGVAGGGLGGRGPHKLQTRCPDFQQGEDRGAPGCPDDSLPVSCMQHALSLRQQLCHHGGLSLLLGTLNRILSYSVPDWGSSFAMPWLVIVLGEIRPGDLWLQEVCVRGT